MDAARDALARGADRRRRHGRPPRGTVHRSVAVQELRQRDGGQALPDAFRPGENQAGRQRLALDRARRAAPGDGDGRRCRGTASRLPLAGPLLLRRRACASPPASCAPLPSALLRSSSSSSDFLSPPPNTFDQKPRFFFGSSDACSSAAFSPVLVTVTAPALPLVLVAGGVGRPAASARHRHAVVVLAEHAGERDPGTTATRAAGRSVVGCVPLAKYSRVDHRPRLDLAVLGDDLHRVAARVGQLARHAADVDRDDVRGLSNQSGLSPLVATLHEAGPDRHREIAGVAVRDDRLAADRSRPTRR